MKKIKITESQLSKIINKKLTEQFGPVEPNDNQLNSTSMPDEANFTNDPDAQYTEMTGDLRPRVFFRNGGSISMQASHEHDCVPKDAAGPYESIELGYPLGGAKLPEDLNDFVTEEDSQIYGFVPAIVVVKLIELNGGVKSGEVPPFTETKEEEIPIGDELGDSTMRTEGNPFEAASDPLSEGRKRLKEDFNRYL